MTFNSTTWGSRSLVKLHPENFVYVDTTEWLTRENKFFLSNNVWWRRRWRWCVPIDVEQIEVTWATLEMRRRCRRARTRHATCREEPNGAEWSRSGPEPAISTETVARRRDLSPQPPTTTRRRLGRYDPMLWRWRCGRLVGWLKMK